MIEINVRDLISPKLIKLASDATMKALEAGGTVLAQAAQLSNPEPARRPEAVGAAGNIVWRSAATAPPGIGGGGQRRAAR